MKPLNVLITNNTLSFRAGSELYVRDVAMSLKSRGHNPIAYSKALGEVAEELRTAGVKVIDDLKNLVIVPDLIHGHHHLETMTALLYLPRTPAIFICHGVVPWEEIPPLFPRILRYVAVDKACLDRLYEYNVSPARIQVVLNFVDLKRFPLRASLPPRPRRALIFSNYASEVNSIPKVREACRRARIELDIMGLFSGHPCSRPEEILSSYDLVFAKARSALEALASGAAVITCDAEAFGCMVNTDNLESLRELNFGIRTLNKKIDPETIFNEIEKYDPDDAQKVSRRIRSSADIELVVDKLLALYQQVIEEYAGNVSDQQAEYKSAAAYLSWLSPRLKGVDELHNSLLHEVEKVLLHKELEKQNILSLLHEVEKVLLHKELEKQNILNSRSWRITQPLRQVKSWLGRILGKPSVQLLTRDKPSK